MNVCQDSGFVVRNIPPNSVAGVVFSSGKLLDGLKVVVLVVGDVCV